MFRTALLEREPLALVETVSQKCTVIAIISMTLKIIFFILLMDYSVIFSPASLQPVVALITILNLRKLVRVCVCVCICTGIVLSSLDNMGKQHNVIFLFYRR